jgi:hypothetical protein
MCQVLYQILEHQAERNFYISDIIDQAEIKNEDAIRNVISKYFNFEEALYMRYKKLKKNEACAFVKKEVSS